MGVGEHMRGALRVKWRLDWPEKKWVAIPLSNVSPPGAKSLEMGAYFRKIPWKWVSTFRKITRYGYGF